MLVLVIFRSQENCSCPDLYPLFQAREEAFEKEREKLRIEKEKEIARLRAQQERAIDKQAERVSSEPRL